MFDDVASNYDVTNDVLSLGQDRRWRRAVVQAVRRRARARSCSTSRPAPARAASRSPTAASTSCPPTSRSGCCGSATAAAPTSASPPADAMSLPFADDSFDAVTICFGLRNVADPDAALREFLRVTKPGGRFVLCEFSQPTNKAVPHRLQQVPDALAAGGRRARSAATPSPTSTSPSRSRRGRPSGPWPQRIAGGRLGGREVAQPLRRRRRPAPRDQAARGRRRRRLGRPKFRSARGAVLDSCRS